MLLKFVTLAVCMLATGAFKLAVRKALKSTTSLQMSTRIVQLTPDGGVIKEVIAPGQGRKIEAGDILAIEFAAYVKGSKMPFAKGNKEQFIVKDGSLIKGWDIAVDSMKIGEKARFLYTAPYAYGAKGVASVIPPNSDVEVDLKILAWLGNQLRPESLFQKDLDIDPFIASTPEAIQAEYDEMQANRDDKYTGGIVQLYLNRIKNISFGFGGSNFFASQSGDKAPWYLNPNITFPTMITIVLATFITVFTYGGVKEKGESRVDLETAQIQTIQKQSADKLFS